MTPVERFTQQGSGMIPTFRQDKNGARTPSGDWVKASDYDQLLRALEVSEDALVLAAGDIRNAPLPELTDSTPRTDAVAPHLNLSHQDKDRAAWKLRALSKQLETENERLRTALQACSNAFALQVMRDCGDEKMLAGWRKLQGIAQAALKESA